jgi:hypothetical protein
MLDERLQVLLTTEQRRHLESEARTRRTSVGALVREAIDAHLGGHVGSDERLRALGAIKAMRGRYLPPDELDRIIEEEREAALAPLPARRRE